MLRIAIQEPEIRPALVGVPRYIHTMITSTAVFLLKVQQQWRTFELNIDSALVRDLIGQVIQLLNDGKGGERYMSYHVASRLTKLVKRQWQQQDSVDLSMVQFAQCSKGRVEPDIKTARQSDCSAFGARPLMNSGRFPSDGQVLDLYENVYLPTGFLDFSAFGVNGQPDFF